MAKSSPPAEPPPAEAAAEEPATVTLTVTSKRSINMGQLRRRLEQYQVPEGVVRHARPGRPVKVTLSWSDFQAFQNQFRTLATWVVNG